MKQIIEQRVDVKGQVRTLPLSRVKRPSRRTSLIDEIGLRPDIAPCSSSVM